MSYAPHKVTPAPWPRGSRLRAAESSPACRGAFGVLGHSLAHKAREGTHSMSLHKIGVCAALVLIAIVALV